MNGTEARDRLRVRDKKLRGKVSQHLRAYEEPPMGRFIVAFRNARKLQVSQHRNK